MFIGAAIEGETVAVMGGIMAHRGLFGLLPAAIAAASGSCVVDQLFFLAGRLCRDKAWVRRAQQRPTFRRALAAFDAHPLWFVFGFRFLTGLRTISPLAIGTTRIPARTFIIVNLIAAAVWGALFVGLGYVFGHGIEALFGRVQSALPLLAAVAAIAVAGTFAMRWWRRRRGSA